MLEFFVLPYSFILWLLFKKFKLIPITQWTIITAVLIGVAGVGFMWTMMNMYQPASSDARIYAYTTSIVPQVKGRVIEVPVQPNVPLKKGDVLFKVDPVPYQNKFDALMAKLKLAEMRLKQETKLLKGGAGKKYDVERLQSDVDSLRAQVSDARYNLEQTVVRAPTEGFVTQLRLRPGAMAVPLPFAPVMTFIHSDQPVFGATFRQNSLQGIEVGNQVEIAFVSIPGRVFQGKVARILPAMGEGQLTASGQMMRFTMPQRPGRMPVIISIEDDLSEYNLPIGSSARVAVYTEHSKLTRIVRKVILRINSWENYVFLP